MTDKNGSETVSPAREPNDNSVTGQALRDIAYWLKWYEDAWRSGQEVIAGLHRTIERKDAELAVSSQAIGAAAKEAAEKIKSLVANTLLDMQTEHDGTYDVALRNGAQRIIKLDVEAIILQAIEKARTK